MFHWDESPRGIWTLAVQDNSFSEGTLKSWRLKFLGTCEKDVSDYHGRTRMGKGSGAESLRFGDLGHRTQMLLVFMLFFISILKSYLN